MKQKSWLVFLVAVFLAIPLSTFAQSFNFDSLRKIPIQDLDEKFEGRVKPFDTFARESVQIVTGQIYFQDRDPVETILEWLTNPEQAVKAPILLYAHKELQKKLGLPPQDENQKYISPQALFNHKEFGLLLQNIALKQKSETPLEGYEDEAVRLKNRFDLFATLVSHKNLRFIPGIQLAPQPHQLWFAPDELQQNIPQEQIIQQTWVELLQAFSTKDVSTFNAKSASFNEILKNYDSHFHLYPSNTQLKTELLFNQIRPFQKAWIVFFIGFLSILFSVGLRPKEYQHYRAPQWLYRVSLLFSVFGLSLSICGFVARAIIAGRPPVTNMYESLIWVSFGVAIFALIFEAIYRSRYFLLSASLLATIGFLVADNFPNSLDPRIHPLVPVLRSNFWLVIHVLPITLSYAAFFLAMGLGQVALGYFAFKPQEKQLIQNLIQFLYRAVQVGVVFLAAGTILGGIWASYSWGRFWGWDPKEVWALIALLGYLAILHGRFTGWIRNFGMAAWCVLASLLVVMAWYGVNFVLGVGLHAYGFSKGGFAVALAFVVTQLAWVGFTTSLYRSKTKDND